MKTIVQGFFGEYRFLSNFYIEPDGTHVEGEFQRAKCAIATDRDKFHVGGKPNAPLLPPAECRMLGRRVKMRDDWEDVKIGIMDFYLRKKFITDHRNTLGARLAMTYPSQLIEWNDWGDRVWGMTGPADKMRGANALGELLMEIREEL